MKKIEIIDKLHKVRTTLFKLKTYGGIYSGGLEDIKNAEEIIDEITVYEAKVALFDCRFFLQYGITIDRIIEFVLIFFLALNLYVLSL